MTQLTVRGYGEDLEKVLRAVARERGVSLNRAAVLLMKKGAGIAPDTSPNVVGSALDHFIGTWSPAEEQEVLDTIRSCDQLDEELWR